MQYRKFPKIKSPVSAFGLGCMRFPMKQIEGGATGEKEIDEENAVSIIRTAIDRGVNYLDTAYVYSNRTNEALVGRALRDGYREKVFLATKLPCWNCETPEDLPRLFQEQCRNLETDHIDFYLLHALNAEKWEKMKRLGAREFLDNLKQQGKITYACFSFHDKYEVFEKILSEYDWDMCQIQFNYMDIENQAGLRGLRLAGSKGVPVVIMEGLLGGRLANAPDNVRAVFDAYPEKRSPVEWAFRWLCNFPEVLTVLSGVTSPEQTEDNLRIFDLCRPSSMSEEELNVIARAREAYQSRTKVSCTGCRYCMPCPGGVDIPRVFRLYNDDSLYGAAAGAKKEYRALKEKGNGADRCISCHACEQVCPQELTVPEKLREADFALG